MSAAGTDRPDGDGPDGDGPGGDRPDGGGPDGGDQDRLDGRVAIITGGTRGIGRAVAQALVEAGATVVVNGRDGTAVAGTVAALTAGGGEAHGVAGSAARPEIAEELVTAALAAGDLAIVVNCAGTAEPPGSSILTVTSADWHALLDAHLTSAFETCRAAAPHLVARGGGAIVNTSSFAVDGSYGGTGYPAGKGGVTSLTYAIAAELAEHGVRANVVCPGARTRLSTGTDYEDHLRSLHERGLLDDLSFAGAQDPGPPEHAAALYRFLVSDRAVGVTGQVFAAAGGFLGRFPGPAREVVTWRDHHEHPPYTPSEIARLLDVGDV